VSVAAITAAWKVDCEPTQKLVLLALADHANDETWKCWPSLGHLHKKTGLNRRTVSRAIKALIDSGLIGRINRGRESTVYQLNVASWGHETPRGTEPLGAESHKGRGDMPPGVGATCPQGRGDMPHEPSGNRQEEPSGNRHGRAKSAHRLPEGWEPTEEVRQQCRGMGLSADAVEWELEKFRDHWMAATKNASKKDWGAAFRNWCRKAVEFRRERNGGREAEEQEEHYL